MNDAKYIGLEASLRVSKDGPTVRLLASRLAAAFSTSMLKELKGCGQTGLTLTLYLISSEGNVRPLSVGYETLPCGHFPSSAVPHAMGMLLCEPCAVAFGFPKRGRSGDPFESQR